MHQSSRSFRPSLPLCLRSVILIATTAFGITACKTNEQTPSAPATPAAVAPAPAHDHSSHSHKQASTSTSTSPSAKPASVEKLCPVSGEVIEDPVVVMYEGQSIELCCKGCAKEFFANPTAYIPKS